MPIDPDPSSPTLLSPLLSWPGGYVIGQSRPISERPLIARTTDTKSAVRIYVRLHAKSPRGGMCDKRYAVARRRNVSPTQGTPCSKPKRDAVVCNIDTRRVWGLRPGRNERSTHLYEVLSPGRSDVSEFVAKGTHVQQVPGERVRAYEAD